MCSSKMCERSLQGTPAGITDRTNETTTMATEIAAKSHLDTAAVVTQTMTTSKSKITTPATTALTGALTSKEGATRLLEIGGLGRGIGRTASVTFTSMISLLKRNQTPTIHARIYRSQILAASIGKWCIN
jgi:hypothetical protein